MVTPRRRQEHNIIVGLDIGTSKVACMIARKDFDGNLKILGLGTHPSKGLKKGVVVNIEETVNSIQQAVALAEQMADVTVSEAYVGIAGSHIKGYNAEGTVIVDGEEITKNDVARVIEAAKASLEFYADETLIHVLSQEFQIDNDTGIKQPVGMSGSRLKAKVHVVTAGISALQNITKCVERCGLEVRDVILEQLASSEAVLSADEKDLGVCLIDIGGGTTDIAIFMQGSIQYTAVIPVAGDQVTNDIAMALRTPTQAAENLKREYACCLPQLVDPNEEIDVPSVGDRPARCLNRAALVDVIAPRYEELFEMVVHDLQRLAIMEQLGAGLVITGGGSLVEGAVELAEEIFHLPVRVGVPALEKGMSEDAQHPSYATTLGLIRFGAAQMPEGIRPHGVDSKDTGALIARVKDWFKRSF